jgi:hypothetical protein
MDGTCMCETETFDPKNPSIALTFSQYSTVQVTPQSLATAMLRATAAATATGHFPSCPIPGRIRNATAPFCNRTILQHDLLAVSPGRSAIHPINQ